MIHSHLCVRTFLADEGLQRKLAHGTPVVTNAHDLVA